MRSIQKNWKSLGFAYGPLRELVHTERSYGAFFTVMDGKAQIGFVFYLGKRYASFWWLK